LGEGVEVGVRGGGKTSGEVGPLWLRGKKEATQLRAYG